jgi:hypothetical protein
VAQAPTVFIVASDQHRNGKTLFARILTDYLLLDGRDPFVIDTDAPDGPLRAYFPGRTQLADYANVQGKIKIFDTILTSIGRDYVIDLTARHTDAFFDKAAELGFFAETAKLGYRIIVFFIVDADAASLKKARALQESLEVDLFVPVRNQYIGSAWPEDEGSFNIPALDQAIVKVISGRRFSLRAYVLGDPQNLDNAMDLPLKRFIYEIMQNLNNLEPTISLKGLLE